MASRRTPSFAPAWFGPVLAVLAATVAFVFFRNQLLRHWERLYASEMQVAVRAAAGHAKLRVDELTWRVRQVASGCLTRDTGDAASCLSELEQFRDQQPRMLRAAFLLDGTGRVLVPQLSIGNDLDQEAISHACRQALASRTVVVRVADAPSLGRLLVVLAPVAGRLGASRVVAVGLALDADALLDLPLRSLLPEGEGVAFLAAADGRLVALAGTGRIGSEHRVEELVSDGRELASTTQPWSLAKSGPFLGRLGKRGEEVIGVTALVAASDETWTVGGVWPRRIVATAIRPPLLLSASGIAILGAGAVVMVSIWFRQRRTQAAGLLDSDRWRDLAERRDSERRWRGLADHNPTPLLSVRGSQVVSANLAAAEALGCDRPSLLGRDLFDLIVPEDQPGFSLWLADTVHGGTGGKPFSGTLSGAAGREVPVEFKATVAEEDSERSCYLSWQPAKPPESAEMLLRAVAAAVPHPLVFCDPDGNLIWANEAAGERTGYSPSRFQGRSLLPAIDPADRRRLRVALGRARRGRTSQGHVRMRAEGGEPLEGDFRAVPMQTGGQLWGVLFLATELTAESDTGELTDRHRDRVLSHLGTSLAHRLRNDLQALLGILGERETHGAPDQVLAAVHGLVTSAVEDLRRFVAISRSGAASPREIDLGEAVERWFSRARLALPKRVRITFRRDVAEDRTVLDATQLALALDVALAAATRAMGESGGAVELAIEEGKLPSTLRITLSDTGMVGEEQEVEAGARRLLFTRETALAVADLVARRHQGRAGSKVRTGIGGRWWIELPRAPARSGEQEALAATTLSGAVLVADDEEMVRSTLAAALREAGVEAVEAANGREAVDLVLASPRRFALVILDLVMPVMDGREALRQLRLSAPGVPVVVCTGYDPAGDSELANADLLIKPFSIEEFLAKVREMLNRPTDPARRGDSITQ